MSSIPSPDYIGVYEQEGLYIVKIYLTADLIPLSIDLPQKWATPKLAANMYNIYARYLDYLLADLNGGLIPQRYYNGDFKGVARNQIHSSIKMHLRDMLDDLNQSNLSKNIKIKLIEDLLYVAKLDCAKESAMQNSTPNDLFVLELPDIIELPPPFLPSNPLTSAASMQGQLKKSVGVIAIKPGQFKIKIRAIIKPKIGDTDIDLKFAISPTSDETWGNNELEAGQLYDQCTLYLDMLINNVGYSAPTRRHFNLWSSYTHGAERLIPLDVRVRVMELLNARKKQRPEEIELLDNLRAAAQLDVANLSAQQSSSSSSLTITAEMQEKYKKSIGVFKKESGYYQIQLRFIIKPKTGVTKIDLKFAINPVSDETWAKNKLEAGKLYDQCTLYLDMLIKNVGYSPPSRKHYNLRSSTDLDAARFTPLEVRERVLGLLNARRKERPEEIELLVKLRAAAQLDIANLVAEPSSSSSSLHKKPKFD